MNPILKLWQSTIGKKIAMAVSGILLVGFLVSHVVSNLSIFANPEHLDAWGRFLRSTGPLLWIARGGLIALDKKRILPCSAWLTGQYGLNEVFCGVPVKLGAKGIEQIIEVTLTDTERAELHKSAGAVKEVQAIV